MMGDLIGRCLGNYRLVRLLGQGGFAEVYLGVHLYLENKAAIKVLRTPLEQENTKAFEREAYAIVMLEHPHIVRVRDFGIEGTLPYLVMDYAPQGSLRSRHARGTPLPLPIVLSYVKQLANALQYAHDMRLVHCDLKPENMLVDECGNLMLADFGIATLVRSLLSQSTQDMGDTVAYMAPEQIIGHPRPASDQYALAVAVYEWLTGTRPFQGSFMEIVVNHLHVSPPPLREKLPNLPLAVELVLMTALAKHPEDRFANIQAFATAFEQACEQDTSPNNAISRPAQLSLQSPLSMPSQVPAQPALSPILPTVVPPLSISHGRHHVHVRRSVWVVFVNLILLAIVVLAIGTVRFSPMNPSAHKDLESPDLHLLPKYVRQMQVNHAYTISVILSSSNSNVPLSAVNGSIVDGQSMPLGTLLGKQNTPCTAASLIVDQTAFRVQPSQPQEYSLEQSQITWIWSVTPLRADATISQEIPVLILFSGKSHCGSGEALTGSYPLAGSPLLLIRVQGPPSPPAQETPLVFPLVFGILSPLLLAFLVWMSIFLWRRRRKKRRHTGRASETGSSPVDLGSKPSMGDQPSFSEIKHAWLDSQDRGERLGELRQAGQMQFVSLREVQPEARTTRLQKASASTSLSIFYCYAREDKALRDQLEKHLTPLQHSGQVITWYDGEIVPGTLWKEEITMRLNAAHLILLLISPDFIASPYCYSKEMKRAMERHLAGEASVIPIILRPVVWDTMPFADLQVLPSGGKAVSSWSSRDEAFYDVVQGIRAVVATLLTRS